MSPEVFMYAVGAVATLLGGWQTRQSRRMKSLTDHQVEQDAQIESQRKQLRTLRGQVAKHATWQATARTYMGQLLYVVAVHGIQPPRPPELLGLTIPEPRTDQED